MEKYNSYSVLMSVYAKEKADYLKKSIQSMLNQTVRTDDFVLVCDGPLNEELDRVIDDISKENTDIFRVYRLDKNEGLGYALNYGLEKCRHELIARMDSDDMALPDRCEKQLEVFNRRAVDIVSGTIREFSRELEESRHVTESGIRKAPEARAFVYGSEKRVPETHEEIVRYARRRNPFNHPCVMYKKASVEAAGGYRRFYLLEDYYLWFRMLNRGFIGYNVQECLLYMRTGNGMYKRRGGMKYIKSVERLHRMMRKQGFCSWTDYIYRVAGHAAVSLSPDCIRRRIYNRRLRNR